MGIAFIKSFVISEESIPDFREIELTDDWEVIEFVSKLKKSIIALLVFCRIYLSLFYYKVLRISLFFLFIGKTHSAAGSRMTDAMIFARGYAAFMASSFELVWAPISIKADLGSMWRLYRYALR